MSQEDTEQLINEIQRTWFQLNILEWAEVNLRDFPWRQTTDPYKIFIAEFLLQQTDAPRVVPIYQELLLKYPDLDSLAHASLSDVTTILKPLGFHYRASRLIRSAYLLVNDPYFGGKISDNEDKLLKLPGVGRYIARSICANAFHQPVAVLDTNVARIIQRFFGLKPRRLRAREDTFFWNIAQQLAPQTNVGLWNLALIDFGSAICTFRSPHCAECPLRQQCKYNEPAH